MLPLIGLVISVGISLLARLLAPRPKSQGPQAPGEFQIPDAVNGAKIPYLCGTYIMTPNICFYGGYHVQTKKSGSSISGGPQQVTQTGYLTHLDVLCLGPVDQLLQIYADSASVSPYAVYGDLTLGSNVVTSVNDTGGLVNGMIISGPGIPLDTAITGVTVNTITMSASAMATATHVSLAFFGESDTTAVLFQGALNRGTDDTTYISTAIGTILFAWGTATQTTDGFLAAKGLPTTSPFPNVCYAVFEDCQLNTSFQVQSINFVLKRIPVTPVAESVEVGAGINPAHMLWDLLTNNFAGSQFAPSDLDLTAFNTMAATFVTEGVGVNVAYLGKSMKEILSDFVAEFDVALRIKEGKLSPVLIRDDYDPTTVPVINEDNADKIQRRREPGSSAPNDLVFNYNNAGRMWLQDPIEIFNLGSLVTVGKRITSQIDLNFVTDLAGASKIAARKVRQINTPADTVTVTPNASVADTLEIGDPVSFASDRLGIAQMYCRVLDLAETPDKGLQLSLQEDVWRIEDATFTSASPSASGIAGLVKPQRQRIIEVPYGLQGDDRIRLVLLFGRGSPSENGVIGYESPDGAEYSEVGELDGYAVTGILTTDYGLGTGIDRTTGIDFDADNLDVLDVSSLNETQFMLQQQLALIDNEIMAIGSLAPVPGGTTPGGRWHITGVIRGLFDTDPAAHLAGSVIYLIDPSKQTPIQADQVIARGNNVWLKATPFNRTAVMDLGAVDPVGPYLVYGRAATPLSVVNLKANGEPVGATYGDFGNIVLTWDYRVRSEGAGVSSADFVGVPHEGVFVINVSVNGGPMSTGGYIFDSDGTSSPGWILDWDSILSLGGGSPPASITFQVQDRLNTLYSPPKTITVLHV